MPVSSLQMRTLVKEDYSLEISLTEIEVPDPGPDQVLVKVEAAPINPSDLGLLFGPADRNSVQFSGSADRPVVTASIPEAARRLVEGRIGDSMAIGNEGAGTVVAAGDSPAAQALVGKTVGMVGGEMYSEYRCVHVGQCLPLNEGTTAVEGASCFVNPMTALGMVETMRMEGHKALVHTAAASNLGQMLNRICQQDDVPLVNIVRRHEQESLLKDLGASYVVNSSSDTYIPDLTRALEETGATLAFDATGGGKLASQILACMESAAVKQMPEYSRYGSDVYKQVYIYGGLDVSPTVLNRTFGFSWGLGGWLLTPFLQRAGGERVMAMRERVAAEIKTTFASRYTGEVDLAGALKPEAVSVYAKQATGEKILITP
ncbi:MAG: NADH oxidase [Halieaceae bacterium]|nr:NADH oxidase [Halieaceae bacterium]